jgi:hypothetical protein
MLPISLNYTPLSKQTKHQWESSKFRLFDSTNASIASKKKRNSEHFYPADLLNLNSSFEHHLSDQKQATFDIAPDPKLITLDSSTTSIDASRGAAADPTSDAFYAMQYMTSRPLNGMRGTQIMDAGRQRRRNVAGVRF